MQGRTIVTNRINASNQSMDVTNLSSGLYQVLIMDGNDLVGTKKLLKKITINKNLKIQRIVVRF